MTGYQNMTAKMKTPLFLSILALVIVGCGGDIEQKCYIQRPALGGYGFVFTATAAATGTCPDPSVLPDTLGDIYTMDKFKQDQSQVGVRPGSLLDVGPVDPDDGTFTILLPTSASLALGDFAALTPTADHLCTVPTLTTANGEGSSAGRSIALSNLVFLTGSLYQGSQAEVDATYTVGGCSRTYHGLGVTPVAGCNPASSSACDPIGNPSGGVAPSGINPEFPVECNETVGALFPFRYSGSPTGSSAGGPVCWFTGSTFPQLK
jgi:hypothetical protein